MGNAPISQVPFASSSPPDSTRLYLRVEGILKCHHLQESCLTFTQPHRIPSAPIPTEILFLPPFRYSPLPTRWEWGLPSRSLAHNIGSIRTETSFISAPRAENLGLWVPSKLLLDIQPCETTFSTHQEVPTSGPLPMAVPSARNTVSLPSSLVDSLVPCWIDPGIKHTYPALMVDSFQLAPPGKPEETNTHMKTTGSCLTQVADSSGPACWTLGQTRREWGSEF